MLASSAATRPATAPVLWVDVEDLFQYASQYRRPSGIQRVAFEIQRALREADPARVRFCRNAPHGEGYAKVEWAVVAAIFERLTTGAADPAPARALARESQLRLWMLRQLYRVPLELRLVLGRLLGGIRQTGGAVAALPGVTLRTTAAAMRRWLRPDTLLAAGDPQAFAAEAAPGDVLLALGANWNDPHQAERIAAAKARFGLRFAALVHDTIPLRRPEWCYRGTASDYRRWFAATLPLADRLCTVSHATAADTRRAAADLGVPLRARPMPIPLGTGFGASEPHASASGPAPATPTDLPAPGSYVLLVSTIEARKNHALLLRAWRHLIEARGPDRVPQLVFAGRVGWMVADLMQQLENAAYFDGKVRLIEDPTDAAVAALYRDCLFTIFPSLYEGWGLPVTESLGFGRPCLASDRTSIPEAGGALARYFDPEDTGACIAAITDWLDHPDRLQAAAARIAAEFRPVRWAATAAAVFAVVDATESVEAAAVAG